MSILIDTNILVYSNAIDSPLHSQATYRLVGLYEAGNDLFVSNQLLREYVAVVSRLQIGRKDYNPLVIGRDIQTFEQQYGILQEDAETRRRLLDLLRHTVIGGKQVHDANLVATALQFDIPAICTHNVADFERFDTLITVIPLIDQLTN